MRRCSTPMIFSGTGHLCVLKKCSFLHQQSSSPGLGTKMMAGIDKMKSDVSGQTFLHATWFFSARPLQVSRMMVGYMGGMVGYSYLVTCWRIVQRLLDVAFVRCLGLTEFGVDY